jgi:hypothetical protein
MITKKPLIDNCVPIVFGEMVGPIQCPGSATWTLILMRLAHPSAIDFGQMGLTDPSRTGWCHELFDGTRLPIGKSLNSGHPCSIPRV